MIEAIILAGGLGTRLRSAVPDLPKPMAPIAGRPFLAYQMDYWIAQGVERFILSVGYKYESICDYFGSTYQDAQLTYVIEREPLGTGGGFLLAAQQLKTETSFLLLNGDTYFEVDLMQLRRYATLQDADWCFALFNTQDTVRYMGMQLSPEGRVLALKSPGSVLANGGVYWVNRRAVEIFSFSEEKQSLEDDLFPKALRFNQRLFGLPCEGGFIDIGLPQDYHHAESLLV